MMIIVAGDCVRWLPDVGKFCGAPTTHVLFSTGRTVVDVTCTAHATREAASVVSAGVVVATLSTYCRERFVD